MEIRRDRLKYVNLFKNACTETVAPNETANDKKIKSLTDNKETIKDNDEIKQLL